MRLKKWNEFVNEGNATPLNPWDMTPEEQELADADIVDVETDDVPVETCHGCGGIDIEETDSPSKVVCADCGGISYWIDGNPRVRYSTGFGPAPENETRKKRGMGFNRDNPYAGLDSSIDPRNTYKAPKPPSHDTVNF